MSIYWINPKFISLNSNYLIKTIKLIQITGDLMKFLRILLHKMKTKKIY